MDGPKTSKPMFVLGLLLVVCLAAGLRWRAVQRLPVDFDEDNYLQAAQHMAVAMRDGDWAGVSEVEYNTEHPQLAKLYYAFVIAPLEPDEGLLILPANGPRAKTLPEPHTQRARTASAALGTLEVLLLALINPLAGLFLAIHTYTIKYTSQIMIEALPALTSAVSVMAYDKSNRSQHRWRWLALSAIALGLTAASKYLYCLVGIVVLMHWLWNSASGGWASLKAALATMAVWGGGSLVMFYVANPYLWPAPIERVTDSILFHHDFSQSDLIDEAGYPTWQPLVWLSKSVPWNRSVFLLRLDLVISLLALVGLPSLCRHRPVYGLWIFVALAFLLAWPTKWPQYVLTLSFPWCLASAYGSRRLMRKRFDRMAGTETRVDSIGS